MGRAAGSEPPAEDYWPGVIAGRPGGPSRLPVHRRGVLGPGVGRCNSRGSTSATTSGSTTASYRTVRSRSGCTSRRAGVPGQAHPVHREPRRTPRRRRCSHPAHERAAAITSPPFPAPRCGTRGSSKGGGSACRCSSPVGRRSRPTNRDGAFYHQLLAVAAEVRTGSGPAAKRADGPRTRATHNWWPGRGSRAGRPGRPWSSTSPASRLTAGPPSVGGPGGGTWHLHERLSGDLFDRDGDDMTSNGLYVGLPPWGCHVVTFTPG